MRLPYAVVDDGIKTGKQTGFGGLNHNEGAGDGEIYAMRNLCSDRYPLLSTREKRMKLAQLQKANGLFAWEKLAWADGTGFYYDGVLRGQVEDSAKSFAAIGGKIVIMPDKKYYDVASGSFGSLEAEVTTENVVFRDGTLYGEAVEGNTIYCEAVDWSASFRAGDALTISGSSIEGNNITAIVREIDGHELRFYEHSFSDGAEPSGRSVSVKRQAPALRFLCENENRLWGCTENTIYACKLGDPFNWFVYDGLDTDSWAVDVGSAGSFTGCVSYMGYPTFFKERNVYKVYGSLPSNFQVMGSATLGLAAGSGQSLAVAGEALLYLSRSGVCAYTGGIPRPIGGAFGLERYRNAVAGSDGLKYYVSMQDEDGGWHLFVFDTQRGLWHEEDETHAVGFAYSEGNLYGLDSGGGLWIMGRPQNAPSGASTEADFDWWAEFGDYTDEAGKKGTPDKRGLSKLLIRLELDAGARFAVRLRFDSRGDWELPAGGEIRYTAGETDAKRSYTLAVPQRRTDHYRIRFEGKGGCRVHSLAREFYVGSELKSTKGRQ